jgi:histidyl-tRNA synthetase
MKPSIPKGTRDFGPAEMGRRNYIFDTIRNVFKRYGYQPIETPSMETLATLLGKYGEEGDKLLFRVLNSGDYMKDVPDNLAVEKASNSISPYIAEKGLRYDLTVPFARFVVQYRNDIVFPFRRYQIQPVWRADKPQKGRYREFYQCDVDVVGSDSLLNEAELVQIIDQVFQLLNLKVVVKLNNRKVLAGIAEYIGHPDKITDITVAIDKLDKIGIDKVNQELVDRGIPQDAVAKLQPVIHLSGTNQQKIDTLRSVLQASELAQKGLDELHIVFRYLDAMNVKAEVELDLTLARGLNYYTGAIFEVKSAEVAIGSICGGGRYDNLTGIFGLPGVSGVGISFGADRIYDVLEQAGKFPADAATSTKVLLVNFGATEELYCLNVLAALRAAGIASEIYPESAKMKKQMGYADARKIPYVLLVGEEEMQTGLLTLKNMNDGSQEKLTVEQMVAHLL